MENRSPVFRDFMLILSGRVTTEGDELYYEVHGQGQPLLMIPAGGGDGDFYLAVADILSDEFKVIIYNRRANSRSTKLSRHALFASSL